MPATACRSASRTNVIDRWIYVFTAASFPGHRPGGFCPTPFAKVAAIHAGQRPPFPLVFHVHAVLMGSFLLLLLAQTILVATGRRGWHMQLGVAGYGPDTGDRPHGMVLAPTIYHGVWNAAQAGPPANSTSERHSHSRGYVPVTAPGRNSLLHLDVDRLPGPEPRSGAAQAPDPAGGDGGAGGGGRPSGMVADNLPARQPVRLDFFALFPWCRCSSGIWSAIAACIAPG